MGHSYSAVSWNRQKKWYDLIIWSGIVLYLATFAIAGMLWFPDATPETLVIRGFSTLAFLLLHVVLSIGPLTRLNPRFLPLLYNRRHLGVSLFIVALVHAAFAVVQFHSFGDINPILSIFRNDSTPDITSSFPFQPLGFTALIILFLMAATSHDFWLTQLTAPVWKRLHMLVYVAYVLLIGHVVFGILQDTTSPIPLILTAAGALWLVSIHLLAGFRERPSDSDRSSVEDFVRVCHVSEIPENRAVTAFVSGDRVAVYRSENRITAISGVCQHQNGPLGEGRIIDGYVTCPWHGYQYCPNTGKSPAPFEESVPTFRTEIRDGDVYVNRLPDPDGSPSSASIIGETDVR
jgi:nitrite reductase/ring-hydroxylating ferredoxin subunit/DMSO/TMAO reductase YedYZ heme-binding membrane subunit